MKATVIPKFFDIDLYKHHFFDRSISLTEEQETEYSFQKIKGIFAPQETEKSFHTMQQLLRMQEALMREYTAFGHKMDMDFSSKADQLFVKSMCYEIITELGEFLDNVEPLLERFNPTCCGRFQTGDREAQTNNIALMAMANEELADAFHFVLEVIILTKANGIEINTLESLMDKAKLTLSNSHAIDNPAYMSKYSLLSPEYFIGLDECVYGGANSNYMFKLRNLSVATTSFSRTLTCMSNMLKNKSWRVNAPETDLSAMKEKVYEMLDKFFIICNIYGITAESLYKAYYLKNRINIIRVKSKKY